MFPFRPRGPDRRKVRPPARPPSVAGASSRARILLVEDDDDTRQLLAIALGGQGYHVEEAASAHEGLKRLRSGSFNLVLTDYDLPGKTGAAMLKDAAEAGLLRDIPTMVLTAHPEPEGLEDTEVLRKPLDLDRFLHQVQRILTASGAVPPEKPAPPAAAPEPVEKVELVLYMSGKSQASLKARANLEELLKGWETSVKLELCDLARDAKSAEEDHVVFTPTLVKRRPRPRVWILGDLSNREVVIDLLYMCGASPTR
ncbi:MAG TPA: response regulator [Vicinamibacteria bacterium]|nr:response regulator [Vicinamibacteria bacterium]